MDEAGFAHTLTLLRSAKGGDREALASLLERYRPILTRRIRMMMGPKARRHAETGDFLQGVFVEILCRLDQFEVRDERAFVAWATQIARNAIRNKADRKYERAMSTFVTTTFGIELGTRRGDPVQQVLFDEQLQHVVEAIEQLEHDQQEVILQRHVEGLSFAAIGERTQRSSNAAQLLHARALSRLSGLLSD